MQNINLSDLQYQRKPKAGLEVRTPKANEDVRVQPGTISPPLAVVKHKSHWYLLSPDIHRQLPPDAAEFATFTVACVVGPDGAKEFILFLSKESTPSAAEAAKAATKEWIQAVWDKRRYDVRKALADHGDVEWPYTTIEEAINVAFQGRYISTLDHPAIKELQS